LTGFGGILKIMSWSENIFFLSNNFENVTAFNGEAGIAYF
jgi:hypothetical protein